MKQLISSTIRKARRSVAGLRAPAAARALASRDRVGLHFGDADAERVIEACLQWLCRAQDCSLTRDGGVSRSFSLIHGWASSYPETTGYIIPTFLDAARRTGEGEYLVRARRMLDWLVSIQMPSGAFQGGKVDSTPVAPVAFNTGQILIGLAAGERELGGFLGPLRRAADWLVEIQDPDGCWRRGGSPFVGAGDKTYDTHIAWALLEAAEIDPDRGYAEAAVANIRWTMLHQQPNGWLAHCCLSHPATPLTHTIGYALRGILEGYRHVGDRSMLEAAIRCADGLAARIRPDGFLTGQLDSAWTERASWACLTGSAQVAHCLLLLHDITGNPRYRDAAVAANRYVSCTVALSGDPDLRGAVRGSFPVDGEYSKFEFPNWAAKFLIDSLLLERERQRVPVARASA